MCHPSCNHIDSPRKKWIEWDAQILNVLFCITGFGLAPWRFRDLYFLLKYRLLGESIALRRLAGIHGAWFRLPGSHTLPVEAGPQTVSTFNDGSIQDRLPYPEAKTPDPPLTGVRAPATALWKLDSVIWLDVWNTLFQVCLSIFMWHMDRHTRPGWATGVFVALACFVTAAAGYIVFIEGKAVNSVEGVPVSDADLQRLKEDREQGLYHYNNIKDQDMAAPKSGQEG